MNLRARIGMFFLIIGIFSLIIFSAYLRAEAKGGIQYFLIGVTACGLGGFIWNRYREKAPPSLLFRLFRRRKSKDEQNEN
jgi:hypothetical protein